MEIYMEKKNVIDILNLENIRYDLIYQVIIWQLSYKRKTISHVKEKSDVRKSTRKIYKQKGTGKARHGSLKANQMRGGGITFGPNKKKIYAYKINKKIKKKAIFNTIALKYKERSVLIYREINSNNYKVRMFYKIYGNFFKLNRKIVFIDNVKNLYLLKSINNNFKLNTVQLNGINVLDMITNKLICFSKKSFIKLLSNFI